MLTPAEGKIRKRCRAHVPPYKKGQGLLPAPSGGSPVRASFNSEATLGFSLTAPAANHVHTLQELEPSHRSYDSLISKAK